MNSDHPTTEPDLDDEGHAAPPTDEELRSPLPVRPDPRQPAYDAVFEYIRGLGAYLPPDPVHRNAVIWRAVHAALDATHVGRCVSSHCFEGDHMVFVDEPSGPAATEPARQVKEPQRVAADDLADACRPVEVDGQTVLMRGAGEFTKQEQQFVTEIVRAAKRKYEAEYGPAADEDAQRTTRRDALRNLLHRIDRGITRGIHFTPAEAALLRQHVEAETHDADTMRAILADHRVENRALREKLERYGQAADEQRRRADIADAVTAETKRLLERRTTTLRTRAEQAEDLLRVAHETSNRSETERARAVQRADIAETELRVLRAGLRANGADPTQIQNLWAQIRLRNRQWAEAKRERDQHAAIIERMKSTNRMVNGGARDSRERAERAEAAIARVRALHRKASHGTTCVYCAHGQRLGYDTDWPCDTIRALNGTEQPITEA